MDLRSIDIVIFPHQFSLNFELHARLAAMRRLSYSREDKPNQLAIGNMVATIVIACIPDWRLSGRRRARAERWWCGRVQPHISFAWWNNVSQIGTDIYGCYDDACEFGSQSDQYWWNTKRSTMAMPINFIEMLVKITVGGRHDIFGTFITRSST